MARFDIARWLSQRRTAAPAPRHYVVKALFCMGYVFLYAPIIYMVAYSVNKSAGAVWGGFSFHWYKDLFENQSYWEGLMYSGHIAMVAATLSVILGTMCASLWTHYRARHNVLGFLSTLPFVIPELVMGLMLLLLYVGMRRTFSWPTLGMGTIIVAHTLMGTAYALTIVRAHLGAMDPSLTEAALNLGARPHKIFFLIKLPILAPSLVASWLVAFVLSFDDVVLASFTAGPGVNTLPMLIFSSMKAGVNPQLNALATCTLLAISALLLSLGRFVRHTWHEGT